MRVWMVGGMGMVEWKYIPKVKARREGMRMRKFMVFNGCWCGAFQF